MKKSVFRIVSILVLLLLLGNPSLAFTGAKNGLILWSQIVLPTLLPFMICSNVIVALDAIHILILPFQKFLHHFLCLSDAGSYTFISGMLCGYPMGAKTCSEFMDDGRITKKEGCYLLAICNHPSPMFLMGYVALHLSTQIPLAVLLLSVYLPVLLIAWLARKYYGIHVPSISREVKTNNSLTFDESLMNSCEVMVKIGGYIMLFSILASYIGAIPLYHPSIKAVVLGIVEITTGIPAIASSIPGILGGSLIAAVTAFGGLSGIFQTKSVIKNAGLSIRHYIIWKGLHGTLSGIIFFIIMYFRLLAQA